MVNSYFSCEFLSLSSNVASACIGIVKGKIQLIIDFLLYYNQWDCLVRIGFLLRLELSSCINTVTHGILFYTIKEYKLQYFTFFHGIRATTLVTMPTHLPPPQKQPINTEHPHRWLCTHTVSTITSKISTQINKHERQHSRPTHPTSFRLTRSCSCFQTPRRT
jgi:hypothetical protein